MAPKRNRFHLYEPKAPYSKPKLVGMINNDNDYDLGTPSLKRQENITMVASNATQGDSLSVNFRWRPCEESDLVCLITKFQLSIKETEVCYEHEEQIIYRPVESQIRRGYFTQYGSPQSSLKLLIKAPYRKFRIIFRGQVKNRGSPENSKFIRANFIITSASGVFDFMDELSHRGAVQEDSEDTNAPSNKHEAPEKRFRMANDRHEQLIKVQGEYVIEAENKVRGIFIGWGFHIRQFIHELSKPVQSKRLLIYLAIGRAYHFGQLTYNNYSNKFAVACLDLDTALEKFTKPYDIDWSQIDSKNNDFELKIGTKHELQPTKASRRQDIGDFYEIMVADHQGWAWIVANDAYDSEEETSRWQVSFMEYQAALRVGKFAYSLKYDPSHGKPLVVTIDDPICSSSDLVGSKASSLAQLHLFSKISTTKYEVPHAFVLTCFVFDAILNGNEPIRVAIKKLETMIGEGQLDNVQSECEQLEKLLSEASVPEVVRQELTSNLESRYGENLERITFAVRSSSWGEDEEDMSAAGQLNTILGVKGMEAIMRATISCFASKFTYANVEYKRHHGLGQSLPMAVIVQELIECDKAGVLFTCDPTTGDNGTALITANYGLGESVVSGRAEPDSIRVRVQQLPGVSNEISVQSIDIGQKLLIIENRWPQDAAAEDHKQQYGHGTQDEDESQANKEYDRSKCCLETEEILRLARCGLILADHYQGPRDIEWGYKGSSLYLFQSRPVTGLNNYSEFELLHEADLSSKLELDIFTRANVGEVMPYAVTPLTLSYAHRFWCLIGFQSKWNARYTPEANSMLMVDSYQAFMSLVTSFIVPRQGAKREKTLASRTMEFSIFGHELNDLEVDRLFDKLERPKANAYIRAIFLFLTLRFRISPLKVVAKYRRLLDKAKADVEDLKYATGYDNDRMLGLLCQVEKVVDFGSTALRNHGCAIIIGNEYNSLLTKMLAKYIPDSMKVYTAIAKILACSPNVISAVIPEHIELLARVVVYVSSSLEVKKFIQMSPGEALGFIKASNAGLSSVFESFMDLFGHRCYNEFELSSKPWRDVPEEIATIIQRNCAAIINSEGTNGIPSNNEGPEGRDGNSSDSRRSRQFYKRLMNTDQLIDSLQLNISRKDRLLLKYKLIPRCQLFVGVREQTKDVLVKHSDLMRRATRMLAEELRRNLRIPDEDLIYYVFYDELEPLVREPQPGIVVQATRRRNLFKTTFREPWLYDELVRRFSMTPIHKRPSVALNETLANAPRLHGTPASSGQVKAKVCLVTSYDQLNKVRPGNILVAHSTDIGYSPVFPLLSGIITEVGGIISHGAVVAREYGLPSILGVSQVTRILKDGDEIILDADNGSIVRL